MPRRLKTYITSNGFFELAVAAPSMKAAIEIWGAAADLFQRGYAKETSDRSIVQAAMAMPGVVLKRGVGGRGAFKVDAELPDVSSLKKATGNGSAGKPSASGGSAPAKSTKADPAADKRATRLYELAQKRREREKARDAAADEKARLRRQQFTERAEAALRKAKEAHDKRVAAIDQRRAQLQRSARAEDERWLEEKRRLEAAIREARH